MLPLECSPVVMQNAVENVYLGVLTARDAATRFGAAQSSIMLYLSQLPEGLRFDPSSESLRRHTNVLFEVETRRSVPWKDEEMREAI